MCCSLEFYTYTPMGIIICIKEDMSTPLITCMKFNFLVEVGRRYIPLRYSDMFIWLKLVYIISIPNRYLQESYIGLLNSQFAKMIQNLELIHFTRIVICGQVSCSVLALLLFSMKLFFINFFIGIIFTTSPQLRFDWSRMVFFTLLAGLRPLAACLCSLICVDETPL